MSESSRDEQARPTPPSVGKLEHVLAHANREGLAVGRVRHWIYDVERRPRPRRRTTGRPPLHREGRRSAGTPPRDARPRDGGLGHRGCVRRGRPHRRTRRGTARAVSRLHVQPQSRDAPARGRALRVWVQIAYRSKRWATIQVDLARPDGADTETERLPGIPLSSFGLNGPADVMCLSMRYHVAQKFHGMTKVPHDGGENDRFRYVDLLLLRELLHQANLRAVREACEDTFRVRAEHPWPPAIVLPPSWREPTPRWLGRSESRRRTWTTPSVPLANSSRLSRQHDTAAIDEASDPSEPPDDHAGQAGPALLGRVRQKGTAPEVVVQEMLRRLRHSHSTNVRGIPGSPDIVATDHSWGRLRPRLLNGTAIPDAQPVAHRVITWSSGRRSSRRTCDATDGKRGSSERSDIG